jgi:hypothetical protein
MNRLGTLLDVLVLVPSTTKQIVEHSRYMPVVLDRIELDCIIIPMSETRRLSQCFFESALDRLIPESSLSRLDLLKPPN